MNKKILGIVAVIFSFVFAQSAYADSWFCGENLHKMVDSLKLDDAQKDKIKPILEELKTSLKESGSKFSDLDSKIKEQTASAKMDESTVDGLIDQKAKLIGDMMKAKMKAKNQVLMVLDDKQKTKLHDMAKVVEDTMAAKYKSCQEEN